MAKQSSKRIAFVTDEYPLTLPGAGGLASYVQRMAHLLSDLGHEVEVFVRDDRSLRTNDGPVLVHHVSPERNAFSRLSDLLERSWRIHRTGLPRVASELGMALSMARAMARVERERPFDLIQSADYQFRGLFVARRGRPHVVRCSWARDYFQRIDGSLYLGANRHLAWLERVAIRRASAAYAPSVFVSRYYRERFGLRVGVVRPPFDGNVGESDPLGRDLPSRYLLHFGQLIRRKGTDLVAAALPLAWELEPDLTMVWVGRGNPRRLAEFQESWGERASQVCLLEPIPRSQLATVIAGASVSVLPSRCDNLPNTAIESLVANVPVIATRDSSIDELVEDEANGLLVPQEDPDALAAAMVRVWRSQVPWLGQSLPASPIMAQMEPRTAAAALLSLADGPQVPAPGSVATAD